MGDYDDQYLKKDVLLLADVFKKSINTCLKCYGLDPCHYFSSLGLIWNAMPKMTGVKLQKISDIHLYSFLEKELRDGVSYITKRHATANNKYTEDYGPKKLSTIVVYLDMNNLYGWEMSDYLPYGRLEWLKNVNEFDVTSISEKSKTGYILEVNLKCPDELHDLHNDHPLAPE